ncbi:MAG: hypothetical protein M1358_10885 [Chloroflexi bacterium]|nr:hypothetical protein [Chloroflexota bacterium]
MKRLIAKKQTTRLVALLLILTLLLPVITTPVGAAAPKRVKIHPDLVKIAADTPDETVRVIVQGENSAGDLDAKLDRRAAKNKKSLPTIKGIAAEMTASEAQDLASDSGVEWVTVDAPMASTVNADRLATDYLLSVDAPGVWNGSTPFAGNGVTVAVVDSGIQDKSRDFDDPATEKSRVIAGVKYMRDDVKHPGGTTMKTTMGTARTWLASLAAMAQPPTENTSASPRKPIWSASKRPTTKARPTSAT